MATTKAGRSLERAGIPLRSNPDEIAALMLEAAKGSDDPVTAAGDVLRGTHSLSDQIRAGIYVVNGL